MNKFFQPLLLAGALVAGGTFVAAPASAAECIGSCGSVEGIFTGSITPAPTNFGKYDWVSTANGVSGAARIAGYSSNATNGSELISDAFFGAAGQTVSFWFNYVTSDGSGYADYGFAQLINTTTNEVVNLFTARTLPSGNIVPGTNMPEVQATLSPASVPIIPGAPVWAPLGGSSGSCYASGCGYTGWIQSDYTLSAAGTYQLRFGAANWSDTAYESGLAFSGLVIDGNTIGDGSSFESPLLPTEVNPVTGAFEFEFVHADPSKWVVIDPEIAVGYDFVSSVQITAAQFEFLGDSEYFISFNDASGGLITQAFTPGLGNFFDFTSYVTGGVFAFSVTGIDESLLLDPTSTTAFKTGLLFNITGPTTINISQTPITIDVGGAVPEPATWAMMIAGFGIVGAGMRRRRTATVSFA
jgi:hypothetical protein